MFLVVSYLILLCMPVLLALVKEVLVDEFEKPPHSLLGELGFAQIQRLVFLHLHLRSSSCSKG